MTINIPLIDGWRILSDKHQFILAREDKGNIIQESFHPEISDVIQELIHRKIKGFDSTSVLELINSIKTLQTGLNEALQPLKLRVVPVKDLKDDN